MKIASVDFFYLSMPEVLDIGDGSQDALLVRVRSEDGDEGWGECEASPLPSIAAWCCPMSHSACKPVSSSIIGRTVDSPGDIRALTADVRRNSFDLLQADHTLSGVDIALWDLLGKRRGVPAWELLGWERALPKTAYASMLFGETPEQTLEKGRLASCLGYRAVKFGWGSFGTDAAEDAAHIRAAREGVGPGTILLIDAGTVWGDDVDAAAARLPVLEECGVAWLEEPFVTGALGAYRDLGRRITGRLKTAAGEGSHDPFMARNMMEFGEVGYIQIDAGRIGGLTSAYDVARYAADRDVIYVNHTFTTPLALSASLQPYAGMEGSSLCEFPVESSEMARTLTTVDLVPDDAGLVRVPERPGLGMTPDPEAIRRYLQPLEIRMGSRIVYETPSL